MSEYIWLNDMSRLFLERDYLIDGQTVDERVDIICNMAESILGIPGFASRFKENIKKGWYSLSTPIWSNFGTERGLPISCFNSHINDSMDSILDTHAEVGMMTKNGGGTSGYFGDLRSRGSEIKDNGTSDGPVHFMQMFNSLIQIISQGSTRRGQFAAYLPVDHADIEEFLDLRSEGNAIQDLSFGVCIPDYWMREMVAGDVGNRKIWAKVLQCRANTGYPYILFTDNANNGSVDVYKDKGMRIKASNLCVTGDQRVVSDRGLRTAKQLCEEGGNLRLFDNRKVVNSSPMQLVEKDADVYKINLSNGMSHTVTSYHKVNVRTKANSPRKGVYYHTADVTCLDLKIGDKVAIQTHKGIFGTLSNCDEAYLLGLYQGDGTQIEEAYDRFCFRHNDQDSIDKRTYTPANFHDAMKMGLNKLGFEKGEVPEWIWQADEQTLWAYIKGLFYTDGTVRVSKSNDIYFPSINKSFLEKIQIILANLGMQTSIRLSREEGQTILPGKGGSNPHDTKTCWRLVIGNKNDALAFDEYTGFIDFKKVIIENRKCRDNTKKFYSVISIEAAGKQDVYCCKVESEEHHWICNGFVTHNCAEIMLPSSEDESFVCDLSSMNVYRYDEWKGTDAVELMVYFLDAVMTEFIEKASKIKHMERAVRFATRHRALGVGWIGWHSYLQGKMIAFESLEAQQHNVAIARDIFHSALAASAKLATKYGEPELLRGYGRRNTTVCAIAPTKSSAFIIGQVSEGIEPHRTNHYIKDLQKGKFTIRNAQLADLLSSKDMDTDEVWDDILKHGGSVQHVDYLTQHEKDVFKTFAEISPKEIVIQAAQRQKYVDQGQSLNLMIHPSVPLKDVNRLMIDAWEFGIKSLYYQISVNAAQQLSRSILTCTACES